MSSFAQVIVTSANDARPSSYLSSRTEQIGLLRDTLGDRSEHVELADSEDCYRSPSAALDRYRDFLRKKYEAGAAWIRIVGEPALAGRSDAEITACTRYESIINLAFASAPATIVCPYDTRSLPTEVVADARRTHTGVAHGGDASASRTYREPEDFLDAQTASGAATITTPPL
jgi:hypothetical protein